MTVGAVSLYRYSGNYNYDTTNQLKYFGMVIPSDRLEQLMQRYGIQESGDSEKDLEALYNAMYPQAAVMARVEKSTNSAPQSETAGALASVPWANIMNQIGLSATGQISQDKQSFDSKIRQLEQGTLSFEQRANIDFLKASASVAFASNQEARTQSLSGAEIQAQLNKLYM